MLQVNLKCATHLLCVLVLISTLSTGEFSWISRFWPLPMILINWFCNVHFSFGHSLLSMLVTDRSKRCRQVRRLQQIQQDRKHSGRVQQRWVAYARLILYESGAAGTEGIYLWEILLNLCCGFNNIIVLIISRGWPMASSDPSLCICRRHWCDRCLQLGSLRERRLLGRVLLCRRFLQFGHANIRLTQSHHCLHDSRVQYC